jgi:hypothetical protein
MKEDKLTNFLNNILQLCDESGVDASDLYSGIEYIKGDMAALPVVTAYVHDDVDSIIKLKIKSFLITTELKCESDINNNSGSSAPHLKIQYKKFFAPLAKKIGQSESSCSVAFLNKSSFEESPNTLEYISELISQSPLFFLFTDVSLSTETINIFKSKSNLFFKSETFESIPSEVDSLFDTFNAHSIFSAGSSFAASLSINKLLELLKITLVRETASQKAKRALNQQHASVFIKGANAGLSQIELLNEIKSKWQNYIYSYEKGFNQRMDDFLRLQTGKLFKETIENIDSLDKLVEIKSHKYLYLTIPKVFENDLLKSLRQKFHQQMLSDLISLKDHLFWVQTQLENIAVQNNFTLSSINFRFLTDASIHKTLDNAIRFDKPFKSERLSKGFMEYMMAARKYQIVLAMFLSTFGLSFIRNLKQYMIPATVLLVGFGIYSVKVDVEKEREEAEKKELDKARESIINECKRIFMEARKDWSDIISNFLREQFQLYISQAELLIKEHFSRSGEQAIDEKKKIQKQLQSNDIMEKKLIQVEKNRDAILKENFKLQMEIKQSFMAIMNSKIDAK